jgi:signal transduction histidine kinase
MELRKEIISLLKTSHSVRVKDLKQSIELAKKAVQLCASDDLLDLKAKAYSELSLYNMIVGDYEESTLNSKESINIYEYLKDEKGVADVKYSIAGVYYKTNDYHLGLVYLVDALNIYKKFNDYYNISRCQKSLGTIYEYFSDTKKAVESYENAIYAAQKINNLSLESNAYNNYSGVLIKLGKVEEAMIMIQKSIKMKMDTSDLRGLAFAIYGRGKVFFQQKRYIEAEANFKESIKIHTDMNERLGLVMAYHKLAKLYVETNQLETAKEILIKALETGTKYNISIINYKAYLLFYNIFKLENNNAKALEYLEYYLKEKGNVLNTQTLKVVDSYDMLVKMKMAQKEAELEKEKSAIIEKSTRVEESARLRQEFLSTMSHEIRTPLNAVTTIVSMLHDEFDVNNKDLIEPLKFSTNHLMNIINDILDFTKLDLGKVSLDSKVVQIKLLLEYFKKTYQLHAKQKGIDFVIKMDGLSGKHYWMDETKMIQILGNLVGNAIKFTDQGKVVLEVKVVEQNDKSDKILFRVIDTGEGIEEDKVDLIFDSFSQIKNITTRKKGGTGLGLAIVKSLVELHESKVVVESTFGKGSIFSFEVEFLLANRNAVNNPNKIVITEFKNKKLLLVEDNAINAFIAKTLITKWGISVDHADNGAEAIQKAIDFKYDFVLMDIHMPEMDGFEATKKLEPPMNTIKKYLYMV